MLRPIEFQPHEVTDFGKGRLASRLPLHFSKLGSSEFNRMFLKISARNLIRDFWKLSFNFEKMGFEAGPRQSKIAQSRTFWREKLNNSK